MDIDSGKGKKISVEYFLPFPSSIRMSYQPLKFSFGNVHPTSGPKISKIKVYEMDKTPHGIALIINNEQFLEHDKREGTAIDERNLIHLFRYLNYTVEVHRNLGSEGMWTIMKEMAKRDHGKYDSFVCCVLSHGKDGHVFGTNSVMVPLNELTTTMDAKHCPTLTGKPKLFFSKLAVVG